MKVKHINQLNNYTSGFRPKATPELNKNVRVKASGLHKGENTANIRPATSVNFGGSIDLKDAEAITRKALLNVSKAGSKTYQGLVKNLGKEGETVVQYSKNALKFVDSEWWNKVLKGVKNNEARFENIITIFLAGLLKPICVLSMPGAEEKDKQTTATKNFVAAVTGFIMSTSILTPISVGVRKVSANLPKYIHDPEYIKQINPKDGPLADAFTTFYKKIADLAITPAKAAITIAFMPYLLNFLFKNKNSKKAQMQAQTQQKTQQEPKQNTPQEKQDASKIENTNKIETANEVKKVNPMEKYLVKGAQK